MSFNEKIASLIQRIPQVCDHLETEESTKTALVMPFIAALGYDVFNPQEVIPEYTTDVGTKKGEKVDYAVMKEGKVILLFECKKYGSDLEKEHHSQLYRYFSVSHARIGILTNGTQYHFFSDLEETNKMDSRPFLELDLLNLKQNLISEVKKLAKEDFNLEEVLNAANELKYTSEIRKILSNQYESPDEAFVKFFFSQVYPNGRFVGSIKEIFTEMVRKSFQQFVNEKVSNRLRTALETETIETSSSGDEKQQQEELVLEDQIVTTEEELEAYQIIRAIAVEIVAADRVTYRDAKSYMSIFLDDNNRKPICRLRFNTKQKYIGTFDSEKQEIKSPIDKLSDIYQYKEQILSVLRTYI